MVAQIVAEQSYCSSLEWRKPGDRIETVPRQDALQHGKGIALGPPALDPEVITTAAEVLPRKEMAALGLAEPGRAKD